VREYVVPAELALAAAAPHVRASDSPNRLGRSRRALDALLPRRRFVRL